MKKLSFLLAFFMIFISSYAMHIMEGFLQAKWVFFWFVLCIPFWINGIRKLKEISNEKTDVKLILALAGAFIFVLSALKIPSVTGSSSHPTGVGLSAILFGPSITSILGTIVLIFQAGLLAHGGFTTLGANTFSMGIFGPIVSYFTYKILKNKNKTLAVFFAASLGNLSTYIITAIQLALAHPAKDGGFLFSAVKFLGIFAVTQIPLAIIEGILTVLIINKIAEFKIERKGVVSNEII